MTRGGSAVHLTTSIHPPLASVRVRRERIKPVWYKGIQYFPRSHGTGLHGLLMLIYWIYTGMLIISWIKGDGWDFYLDTVPIKRTWIKGLALFAFYQYFWMFSARAIECPQTLLRHRRWHMLFHYVPLTALFFGLHLWAVVRLIKEGHGWTVSKVIIAAGIGLIFQPTAAFLLVFTRKLCLPFREATEEEVFVKSPVMNRLLSPFSEFV